MLDLTRRSFCRFGMAGFGLSLVPASLSQRLLANTAEGEPHFFLHIVINGGMDISYLFDARPLAMTKAGVKSNYLEAEPEPWQGRNGGQALATSLVKPLEPYRDRFTVLNGVMMATTFDGHDQNSNYMFTGNPFGGPSYIPYLNQSAGARPIDFVRTGTLYADITNSESGVPVNATSANALAAKIKGSAGIELESPLMRHLMSRFQASGAGRGSFSKGARAMRGAALGAPQLAELLKDIHVTIEEGQKELVSSLGVATQFFKSGATTSAIIEVSPDNGSLDTHDPTAAKQSPKTIGQIAEKLGGVFAYLAETSFDGERSMLDVTTVLIGSEFSRTIRQSGRAIDNTGTDHNPLTNTILVGGKGITGNQVLGRSDFREADEQLSGAHLRLDPAKLKIMGAPFDFDAMQPVATRPENFDPNQYLTFASIANTIMSMFGVDASQHWLVERNGKPARILASLLA